MKRKVLIISGIITVILVALIFVTFGGAGGFSKTSRQINLGNKYLKEGKYEEAILAFEEVIRVEPKSVPARIGLAKAYIATDKPEKAETSLKEAIDLKPGEAEGYIELARLYENQGRINEEIKLLEEGYKNTGNEDIKKLLEALKSKAENLGLIEDEGTIFDKFVFLSNNSIYYCGNDGLYKSNTDGTSNSRLVSGDYIPLKVSGQWIYFYENDPDYKLTPEEEQMQFVHCFRIGKMKLDGSEKSIILRNVSTFMKVQGEYIYYLDKISNNLCKLSIISNTKTQLTKDFDRDAFNIFMDENGFYYSSNGIIYRLSLDCSTKSKILDTGNPFITNLMDGWIYYINYNSGEFFRMDTKGAGITSLGSGFIGTEGEYSYYLNTPSSESVSFEIYKIKQDGSDKPALVKQISSSEINGFSSPRLYKGNIYFMSSKPGNVDGYLYELYKLNTSNGEMSFIKQFEDLISPRICAAGDWLYIYDEGEEEDYYPTLIESIDVNNASKPSNPINSQKPELDNRKDIVNVSASSELIEKIPHMPEFIKDNDTSTAWVEGAKGNGINEWILMNFNQLTSVSSMDIINGYSKSNESYYANSRIKRIRLEFSDGSTLERTLKDGVLTFQSLSFDKAINTTYVKLVILDVYSGSKYQDTCVSEIKIY